MPCLPADEDILPKDLEGLTHTIPRFTSSHISLPNTCTLLHDSQRTLSDLCPTSTYCLGMERTGLEPISVAFIERKDVPWISHQLIRRLRYSRGQISMHTPHLHPRSGQMWPLFTWIKGEHANSTLRPQHREHCVPWGFESKTTVPPVNAVASFIIPVIVFMGTGGQKSCAASKKLQSGYI